MARRDFPSARVTRRRPVLRSLCLLWSALSGCQSSAPLATLELTLGTVERNRAAEPGVWQAASVGATFALGDGIQTHAASSALLQLADADQLSLDPETRIRFSSTRPARHTLDLDLELGSLAVFAAQGSLALQTGGGHAQLAAGSRVALSRQPDGVVFLVQVGQAVFGDAAPLEPGHGLLLEPTGQWSALPAALPAAAAASAPAPAANALTAPPVATGAAVTAQVSGQRARMRTEQGWTPLTEGTSELAAGTELELGSGTSVRLERGDERATLKSKGRYVVAPRQGVLVSTAGGSLAAGSSGAVRIDVPGGTIEVVPQGQALLMVDARATLLEVQARQARLETSRATQSIHAGESARLLANGTASVEGRSLDYADTQISVGESVVIHDPAPPTALRFDLGSRCAGAGVVTLFSGSQARGHAVGQGALALAVPAGSYRYELRCDQGESVAAQGRVQVLRDSGTRSIAAHPPTTTLQADGRDYTVLYQSRLPEITLLWRDAPADHDLRLIHEYEGQRETLSPNGPAHVFASGSLKEGRHVLHFEGAGKLSRPTTVNVAFDNAAPTAAITTPPRTRAEPGEPVTISGTMLAGWDVSVEGQPASRDAQGRFSASVAWPSERRALAVRLSHPERGVHLYLRRAQP